MVMYMWDSMECISWISNIIISMFEWTLKVPAFYDELIVWNIYTIHS